jgi:hypothetical protein
MARHCCCGDSCAATAAAMLSCWLAVLPLLRSQSRQICQTLLNELCFERYGTMGRSNVSDRQVRHVLCERLRRGFCHCYSYLCLQYRQEHMQGPVAAITPPAKPLSDTQCCPAIGWLLQVPCATFRTARCLKLKCAIRRLLQCLCTTQAASSLC